tara:strand:+ start:283 stop:498 length:216 start_codon:yes stop_codon:yes gene_type:complete
MISRILVLLLTFSFFGAIDLSTPMLVFSDEFNKDTLDLNSWSYDLGDGCPSLCGWGNNERQLYKKKCIHRK